MPGSGSEYISGSVPYNMVPQVVNPSDGYIVSSNQNYDKFQTMTGAPITAEMDWSTVFDNRATNNTDATTSTALLSYADGINVYINYSEAHNTLPLLFKLLGVSPYYWTPVYSFAVQEIMAQTLEFGDTGLFFACMNPSE